MVKVRTAKTADAGALLEIYAPYILHTGVSFENLVPSPDEFAQRIDKCLQRFPWIVCECDGVIAGYVYASPHRDREAYQWTCECSVYVRDLFKGKAVARVLYETLFILLRKQGLINLYAGITLPNQASVRLHEKCGFEFLALYEKVGYKQGHWHNVGWWKLRLNEYHPEPPPPLKFSELDGHWLEDQFHSAAQRISANISG